MKIKTAILITVLLLAGTWCWGRSLYESDTQSRFYNIGDPPYTTIAVHNIGKMGMTITNVGIIGLSGDVTIKDPLTGQLAPSMAFPNGFNVDYLHEAALWVGAIVGRDTLVSAASGTPYGVREFWPLPYPEGDIKHWSTLDRYAPEYDSAVSQQDFVAIYSDTIDDVAITGYDYFTGRLHRPLKVEVVQRSYAWGYDYAEDFIIVDYQIGNIELRELKDVYIGLMIDNDIGRANSSYKGYDDICGFKKTMRSQYISGLIDTLDVVWAADNDGDPDPYSGAYAGLFSPTSVIGVKVLRAPSDEIDFSFNWWIPGWDSDSDWGPRRNQPGGVREFYGGRLGSPITDADKYYMMASKEFDYNQEETYYDRSTEGWLPPPENAMQITYGGDVHYLLSFGPFNMKAGDILPLTVAFIGGQNFYTDGLMGSEPRRWRDFRDLQLNTLWAYWVYDNPGVDTDGDGFKGKYHVYCMNPKIVRIDTIYNSPTDTTFDTVFSCAWGDTLYYAGDGVADLRGAAPPVSPLIETYPRIDEFNHGEITIRWNGYKSETTPDQFSQKLDFEGYRVYVSRSGQPNDFTLVTSYDKENYDRYEYDLDLKAWVVKNPPYELRLLRNMYGDNFDPGPYYDAENLFAFYNGRSGQWEFYFFTRHDWNQSDYTDTTRIHRVYPEAPYPSTLNLDTARMFYPDEVTGEGRLKYFEYRYVLRNLIPSIPYYVSVSAFDQGIPGAGLPPLEANPAETAVREFAQNSDRKIKEEGLNVIVYPNPYRIDQNYRQFYEGWEQPNMIAERTRALHFTNLPHRCTIRIFSLDGDLIDEVEHNFAEGDPGSMHDTWDMISRNDMAITSGIYYYSIESDEGSQIGKFVVIY